MRSRLPEILSDYVAGDLDEDARRDVERRLAGDPRARALLQEIRAAHEALLTLRDRPEPPVPAHAVLPAIRAAIAADSFAPRPRLYLEGQGTRFYRRLAIAATLLLAVTLGTFALTRGGAPAAPAAPGPVPVTRDLKPVDWGTLVELGNAPGGLTAEEYFRLLEAHDRERFLAPGDNVVPIGRIEER